MSQINNTSNRILDNFSDDNDILEVILNQSFVLLLTTTNKKHN